MSAPSDQKILTALRQLLKPIVAFALRHGLRIQELNEALRSCVVDCTKEALLTRGEEANISRLAALSGIQRKEIKRVLDSGEEPIQTSSVLARVIGRWEQHPDYRTSNGEPRTLGCAGADSEFAELVRSVSVDLNPYTVIFALEHSGMVTKVENQISLQRRIFDPGTDIAGGLQILAQDLERLVKSVEYNLFQSPKIPNLHITTFYDNICVEDLDLIRNWLLEEGGKLHARAREYLAQHDKDANPRLYAKSGGAKVSLTTFGCVFDASKQ